MRELRPGYLGIFCREGFEEKCYWKLQAREHTDNYAQNVEHVGCLVRDAIARQMASDVPVCSFLSGGLDFSIITAEASRFMGERCGALNTFLSILCGKDQFFHSNRFQPARTGPLWT